MRTALAALVLATTALASATPVDAHANPRRARRGLATRELARAAPAPDDLVTRRIRVLDAFARSGHVRRCWTQQLQREPHTPARTLRVRIDVGPEGRTRGVSVSDPAAPGLARCVALGAWSLPAVGPGEGFAAESTVHLDRPE